jgi:hypothetical protein
VLTVSVIGIGFVVVYGGPMDLHTEQIKMLVQTRAAWFSTGKGNTEIPVDKAKPGRCEIQYPSLPDSCELDSGLISAAGLWMINNRSSESLCLCKNEL